MKGYFVINWATQSFHTYADKDQIVYDELKHTPLDCISIYEFDTEQGFLYTEVKITDITLEQKLPVF